MQHWNLADTCDAAEVPAQDAAAYRLPTCWSDIPAAALTCDVVTSAARLEELRAEWDDVWHRAAAPRHSQSHDWAMAAWQISASRRSRDLWVLVMRQAGRPVLIWPMTLRRKAGCRIAEGLGSDSCDFDPLLVADGPQAGDAMATAWAYVRACLPADIVHIPFVAVGSRRAATLAGHGLSRFVDPLPCPVVEIAQTRDWSAYWTSRKKKLRQGIARRQRRLEELGQLEIRWLHDHAEIVTAIDAMLGWKADWARAKGLRAAFLERADYRQFLIAMATRATDCGQMKVMAALLDGRPIAVSTGSTDGHRFEGYVTTFDRAYDAVAPGTLLLAACLQWCSEQGLDCDMRIGAEPYKLDWATTDAPVANHDVTLTARGAAYLALRVGLFRTRHWRDRLRNALPAGLRAGVKRVLSAYPGNSIHAAATPITAVASQPMHTIDRLPV